MRIPLITCIASCTLLAATLASAEPRWAELNREARQAITGNDYRKLYATLAQLAPLMPGNVRIAYNTAAAAAHLGDASVALAGLGELCNMGLVFDLDADTDLDSLHASKQYVAARRCMERNQQPVTHARLLRVLSDADLLPEDIAYDPKSGKEMTDRELEILHLTADGLNSREVAQQLVLSVGTIRWYLKLIYSKLDVHSRWEAEVAAIGDWSYSLYLLHPLVFRAVKAALLRFGCPTDYWAVFAPSLLGALVLSHFSFYFLELRLMKRQA